MLFSGTIAAMPDEPANCFDMLAADARWSTFSTDERRKVDLHSRSAGA